MNFKFLATILVSAASLASATPAPIVPKAALDVFTPTITSPTESTVWTIGKTVNVTWDPSNAPTNISNGAMVYLREADIVLAQDFDLRAGTVNVTVPCVKPGQYQLILFGDSGNWSPFFWIDI